MAAASARRRRTDGTTERTMNLCKTGADHIKSLKDGRTVYIDGQERTGASIGPGRCRATTAR